MSIDVCHVSGVACCIYPVKLLLFLSQDSDKAVTENNVLKQFKLWAALGSYGPFDFATNPNIHFVYFAGMPELWAVRIPQEYHTGG